MMQQQMPDQNQPGCQPSGQQQMVLCPVRVVYETQMLMPPGDQMHPNQTFYINPQNPPPWVQNRQMPNQVIYVQQIPNNYMPSVQQQIDPNQLYFQQAYQQIVQQPMMTQTQDMGQYQVNMMPTNVLQSSPNVGPNIPTQAVQQNERINEPNYIQVQPNINPNIPIANVNSPQIVKPQNVQAMQNQQMLNQRQVYVNPGQQSQQINMTRPQLMTVNPMQQGNVQFDKTQGNHNTTNIQSTPQSYASVMANARSVNTVTQNETKVRKMIPNMNQIQTNVRNVAPNYMYRAIQPRPQYRTIRPNGNFPNTTPQIPNPINIQPVAPNANLEIRKINEELKNRKRKSESPDELNNKVAIVNINSASPSNPIRIVRVPVSNPVTSAEIGVNTSPVHRPKPAVIVNDTKVNVIKNEDVKSKEVSKQIDNIASEKDKEMKTNLETSADKIRYTVFPQARVRPPKDEFNKININILKDTKNILYTDEKNEVQLESKSLLKEKILSRTEVKKEIEEKAESAVNTKTEEIKDVKAQDTKDQKEEKDFVLTHVLDGIVIQESNAAFPIRDPIKATNTSAEKKRDVVKVDEMLKGNCLELPISDLKEGRTKEDKDNPFIDLKTATVKSWTVDELCLHLTKYKWDDTTTLLQEHEIDGESLFLVSKPQLLHIGVKEKYADLICEFVKS